MILGFVWATIGSAKSVSETGGTLAVGMALSYPPFEMTDEKGTPKGVSVDLAHALGEYLGKKIVIQNTAFDGLIPALQSGKIDLIISSMTITDDRKKAIDFSDPYLSTGLCLLVGKASPVHSIDDLDRAGISVAVKKGTTGHIFAAQKIKNANILVLDKEAAAILEVVQRKADAFIYDQMSTYQSWKKNQETTRALLHPFQVEHWGIAMRKGEDTLKTRINLFLKTFLQGGAGVARFRLCRLGRRLADDQPFLLVFFQPGALFLGMGCRL